MKYVSWMKMSTGVAAMKMPDSPPMMNIDTNDRANSIGVVNWMLAAPDGAQPVEHLDGAGQARSSSSRP